MVEDLVDALATVLLRHAIRVCHERHVLDTGAATVASLNRTCRVEGNFADRVCFEVHRRAHDFILP
jgi:hypothetical protein